jgi:hypothetical protein
LVDAGALGGDHLTRRGGSLGRLAIDSTRDILATDGKIAGSDIGLVSPLKLFC